MAPDPTTRGYTVLARRYRSRTFEELIGQEPIARTLTNAIASDRTAHAYLFCGTRGVGKTSAARIFARMLNATDDLVEQDQIAEAILRGDDLDVIEIDGASNRGVQEARDLIAGAGLAPARCPYRIYIIDEVHALTKDAFNTLLKTMEEPPSHVKFILCTTEPERVPATIQSRCQRFNFRAIPTPRIADQLITILGTEGIGFDEETVHQVARLGNGSMRDALSVLDRLLAAGETTLTAELLEQMLGLPDAQLIIDLVDAIGNGEAAAALDAGASLLTQGVTPERALEMLAEHLRNLMLVCACGGDSELLEVSPDTRARLKEQAVRFDTAGLVHMIALVDNTARNVRGSSTARALFDAALVQLCLAEHLANLSQILNGTAPAEPRSVSKKKVVRRSSPAVEPTRRTPDPAPVAKPPPPAVAEVKPAVATTPEPTGSPSPSQETPRTTTPLDGAAMWARVREAATASKMDRARTEHLSFKSLTDGVLTLTIDAGGSSVARMLEAQRDVLADLVERIAGVRVRVLLESPRVDDVTTPEASASAIQEARRLPVVAEAMDLFEASIVDVRVSEAPTPEEGP